MMMSVASTMFGFFLKKTILAKPLPTDLPSGEKKRILYWRNHILSTAKVILMITYFQQGMTLISAGTFHIY